MAKAKSNERSLKSKDRYRRRKSQARAKRDAPNSGTKALKYIPWHTIPLEDLNPLLQRQFVVGQEIMLARVLLKKGCIVPQAQPSQRTNDLHSRRRAQVLDRWQGDRGQRRRGLSIPPNMPHKAEAMEDTVDLDVFNPPRADWINKTDQYLREEK